MDLFNCVDSLAARVPTDENTHLGDDGLLYCNECGHARQCRIDVPLVGLRIVPCVCKCLAEKLEQEEAERRRIERMDKIMRFRRLGFCLDDEEIRNAVLDHDDGARPDITALIKGYIEHFDEMEEHGQGLLFYGPVGTGKSFYAGCIFNGVIDQCRPALMTNFSRLVNEINASWEDKQTRIDRLATYSLVVIDDLGVERDSDYMNEQITVIIDTLARAHVPIIVTSNYTPKQLTEEGNISRKRIYDRVLKSCRPVPVLGESRRKQIGKDNFEWMKRIIGV